MKVWSRAPAWLAGVAAGLAVGACGSGGGSSSGPGFGGGCPATGIVNVANHGHSVTVPAADVQAGAAKTYDIRGSADHTHSITVTAPQMTDLKNGNSITTRSTQGTNAANGNHAHDVTIRC